MYRFSGGTSFLSNGYVIWRNGLAGQEPNYFARQQGGTYVNRMFYTRSLDTRSSFYQFTHYLAQIQQKEADKERAYLNLKLEKMRTNPIQRDRIQAIQRAVDDNNFGLAYTLMLDLDTSIDELKRELQSSHFNNISHMNKFWGGQFSTYLQRILEQRSEIQGLHLVKKAGDSPLTIEELVNGWLTEMLTGSSGVIAESLEPIREQMKRELLGYLQKKGIQGVNSYTDDIFGADSNFTTLSGFKTTRKKGGHRSVKTLTTLIADAVGNAIGMGMSQEILVTAEQGRGGGVSINTGTFLKDAGSNIGGLKVQQKGDVMLVEMFDAEYDLQNLASTIFGEHGFNQDAYNKFMAAVEEAARNSSSEVFSVSTSVKGYRSKRDLSIEGVGSFKRRTQNLVKMAQEAEGIPALSMEKLIFMLNNTVEGCIADDQIEGLTNYIAAVCVAWMWDDYTDLFSLSESGSAIQKIRMFNSGGFYYSASQIIGQTLDELLGKYSGSSFVVVDINPPSFDADGMYQSLMEQYPVPNSDDKAVWQAALAPRWNAMRDFVSANGTISIKMMQAGLEQLIGNLTQYL